jgi:hypothetical protein
MGILRLGAEIMSCKSWCVALAVLGLAAFEVNGVFASGHGTGGSHARGPAGCRAWGNSRQFLRAENGIFGPTWAYGNAYWGWGGYGYGSGYGYGGWGYSPLAIEYDLGSAPYFALFPPVYYGYGDNMPIVKAPIRSSWVGGASNEPVPDVAASASPSRPPLRIVNPYYVEAKADKP